MPTCNCPITKTLDVFYQVTDPPATANHVFRWRVVGDAAFTTISPNPTPILVSAPNNYKVQLANIPVCQDVEVSIQRQCPNNQNSIVQTSIAQAGLSYGCTQSVSGTRTGNNFYIYPAVLLNLSNAPETVTLNYSTVDPNNPSSADPPNRFLIKNSEDISVYSSGWKGQANYTGEWGASLNTATTGSFTFNRGTGCFYTVLVDTLPNGTQTDFWSLTIDCTNTVQPPADPVIEFNYCSGGVGRYTITGTAGIVLKVGISASGQLTNTNSPNNCAAIDTILTSSTGGIISGLSPLITTTGTTSVGVGNTVFLTLTIPETGYITIDTTVTFKNSAVSSGSTATLTIFEVNGVAKNITRSLCIGTLTTSIPCVTDPPPCECPVGYTLTPDGSLCVLEETIAATAPTQSTANRTLVARTDTSYGFKGAIIYTGGYNVSTGVATGSIVALTSSFWTNPDFTSTDGPLNRVSVWTTLSNIAGQRISFSTCININQTKTYLVGVGCDNRATIKLNGVSIVTQSPSALTTYFRSLGATLGNDTAPFVYWHIYPVTISAGNNVLEITGINDGSVAGVGVEIYDATAAELELVDSYTDLGPKLLFSTKDLRGTVATGGDNGFGYSCPTGYVLKTCGLTTPICYKVTTVVCDVNVVPPTITVLSCSNGVGSYRITGTPDTTMKVSLFATGSLTNNNTSDGYCSRIDATFNANSVTNPTASAVSNVIQTSGTATVGASNALFINVTIPSSGSVVIVTQVSVINSSSATTNATLKIFEVNGVTANYTQSVCVSDTLGAVLCSGATVQNYFATKYSCTGCEPASLENGVLVAFPSTITPVQGKYYVPGPASSDFGSFVFLVGPATNDGPGLFMRNVSATTCSGACTLSVLPSSTS
jgi:hypothetical protein